MELPATADVAIVGGGFAGLATAWALARRGVDDVVVLEREDRLGVHASGRGAGLGRQLAEDDATTELTVRGAALLRSELSDAWAPSGGVLSFDDPGHAEAYQARAARFAVATMPLPVRDARARWPALTGWHLAAALAVPSDGTIDIVRLRERYAARARIVTGVAVQAIAAGEVTTGRGVVAARVVVDASGAWGGALAGEPPLDVLRRHVFVLAADAPGDAPWHWHLGADELYVRPDAGGTLASPCDATRAVPTPGAPPTHDPEADALLAARLAMMPALAAAPIVRRWACLRSFTASRQMRLGRDAMRPWLVWAIGLGGHGATASPAVGVRVADAVIEALS
jgi:glycine/D-amino acid oxidase-like deaminating enzyme